LSDARQLTSLVGAADFEGSWFNTAGKVFPSVEQFVLSYVNGSPLAGPVSQANDAAREKLISDAKNALGKYISNRELAFPIAAHLVSARV
jgi:hypothetical protein